MNNYVICYCIIILNYTDIKMYLLSAVGQIWLHTKLGGSLNYLLREEQLKKKRARKTQKKKKQTKSRDRECTYLPQHIPYIVYYIQIWYTIIHIIEKIKLSHHEFNNKKVITTVHNLQIRNLLIVYHIIAGSRRQIVFMSEGVGGVIDEDGTEAPSSSSSSRPSGVLAYICACFSKNNKNLSQVLIIMALNHDNCSFVKAF